MLLSFVDPGESFVEVLQLQYFIFLIVPTPGIDQPTITGFVEFKELSISVGLISEKKPKFLEDT